jgi:hypothetical protein
MSAANAWEWTEAGAAQRWALGIGTVGAGACIVGAFVNPAQFFHSYLLACMMWLAISLGSLPLLMLHHLTGGVWGVVIRRILEAFSRTLPLMLVLFVPLALGLGYNYEWARHSSDPEHPEQAAYLDLPFFLARAGVYFAIWLVLMYLLNRWSAAHDRTGDPVFVQRAQQLSGPGLILYALTITFAGIDWVMSLDSHWYSTIFGPVMATGQMLPALALAIAVATCLAPRQPFAQIATPAVWNDLGNLLLAFVMLWTYMAFSQFLLIWTGNLPEEISWYVARSEGGWIWVAVVLAVCGFALPFLFLLVRDIKRDPARLRVVALAVVAIGLVNQFWLIAPAFSPGAFALDWMDLVAPVAVGGIWGAYFLWQIQMQPVLPLHPDTPAEEVLHHA